MRYEIIDIIIGFSILPSDSVYYRRIYPTDKKPLKTKIMSWVRIWIHMVFSTKNGFPFLTTPEIRNSVFSHIQQNAKEKEIWLDCANGHKEHIHCLISLGKEQTISKVAQLIKGESSFWINKNRITTHKFEWQDDYWAVSVSESHLKRVRNYIANQEEHQRKNIFIEEVDEFINKYGWNIIKGNN